MLKCILTTSLRFGTIIYKSRLKLIDFVMLVYCFTERNRTNAQTSNEAFLLKRTMKTEQRVVSQWFMVFRSLDDGSYVSRSFCEHLFVFLGNSGLFLSSRKLLAKGSHQWKKSPSVWKKFKWPWPPPPPLYFWNALRNFLENHILDKLKFLKMFGFWSSSPIFHGKCRSHSRKKYLIIFGIRPHPPPLPEKCPNSS